MICWNEHIGVWIRYESRFRCSIYYSNHELVSPKQNMFLMKRKIRLLFLLKKTMNSFFILFLFYLLKWKYGFKRTMQWSPRFLCKSGTRVSWFLSESSLRMTKVKHFNTEMKHAVCRNKTCNDQNRTGDCWDETCNDLNFWISMRIRT